jgi:membrane protein DedA with SNARE-associated domain
MLHWMAQFVSSLNYMGVAVLMAIENVVLPLPSELIMPLAGFETANGTMGLVGVILAGTIGSVIGALPLYYAGCFLGEDRLRSWIQRNGSWLMMRGRDFDRVTKKFSGNNFVAVAIGQVVPGVRGLISLPAGVARMNVGLFLLANFVGTLVWCAILAVAGRMLGVHFPKIHNFVGPAGWTILALLLVALVAFVLKRRRQRRASQVAAAQSR